MLGRTRSSSRHAWAVQFAAALVVVFARMASGQEPATDDKDRQERLAVMKEQAAAYTLELADAGRTRLMLHDEPVLRFSNPVGGVPDGIVVMWKEGERPAVFAQVFQTKEGLWIHECQSLASAGLAMQAGGKTFWQPKDPAGVFRRLEHAPPVSPTAGRRLVQMKALAAEFSAADDFKISSQDKETTRHELRLLPTPIYRYADEKAGIEDGAVFAFVHGTDPEVFLVLEHRRSDDGKPGWHYALAPMTCWAVHVEHAGGENEKREVWSAPERLNKSQPGDSYHVWIHRSQK